MGDRQRLTSVFDIPQIQHPETQPDYHRLYEQERNLRLYYQEQTRSLEDHIKSQKPKQGSSSSNNLMGNIRSFKERLPNSVRELVSSRKMIHEQCLIKNYAVYGLTQQDTLAAKDQQLKECKIIQASDRQSQIVQHTARLVFPNKVKVSHKSGQSALTQALNIINLTQQNMRSFVLCFEPDSYSKHQGESTVIDMVNPERRTYAICLKYRQFTVISEDKQNQQKGTKKTVKFMDQCPNENVTIAVSERVFCIFSYYPFFSFFEEIIRKSLQSIKVTRYIKYKESKKSIRAADSLVHMQLIKNIMKDITKQGNQLSIQLGKLIDFSLGPDNKVQLQLSQTSCRSLLASQWAYSILSLFTLDDFISLFTLLFLQQKIVFVCPDLNILTYAVFLFGRVLIQPLQYPYPLVSIMPEQQDYLNAPFPVIYGYSQDRSQFQKQQLAKRYKNVYVLLQPQGVEIVNTQNLDDIYSKRSLKLRDKLLGSFKKMKKNIPKIPFPWQFWKKQSSNFNFDKNDKALAAQIIDKVQDYIQSQMLALLPNTKQIQEMRESMESTSSGLDQINERVMLRVKTTCQEKSRDPFFKAFLETQMVGVHLLQY